MVSVESMVLAASFFALKNPGLARVENQKFRVCRVMSGSSGQVMLAVLVIEGTGVYWWVPVGTDGYWWVLVGTGGYWWVPAGTGVYWWVLVGTGVHWWVLVGTSGQNGVHVPHDRKRLFFRLR